MSAAKFKYTPFCFTAIMIAVKRTQKSNKYLLWKQMHEMFMLMKEHRVEPDLIHFTMVIEACTRRVDDPKAAYRDGLKLFENMQSRHNNLAHCSAHCTCHLLACHLIIPPISSLPTTQGNRPGR